MSEILHCATTGWSSGICQNSEHRLLIPYDVRQDNGQKRLDLKSDPTLSAPPILFCGAEF